MAMRSTLKLRAHHLLCLQGFQGYGYNDRFLKNLSEIHKQVQNLDQEIELISGIDDICGPCVHHKDGRCASNEKKIQNMDQKTLEFLGLQTGVFDSAQTLFELSNKKFKTKESVEPICGECEWREQCLWYQRRAPSSFPV